MINSIPSLLHTYFENAVGRLLEHPVELYISVEYHAGPRQLGELQSFLNQAGQLLAQRGWDKLRSDKGMMAAFTAEELAWIIEYWSTDPPTYIVPCYCPMTYLPGSLGRALARLYSSLLMPSSLTRRLA
jgi:hypothetical protein